MNMKSSRWRCDDKVIISLFSVVMQSQLRNRLIKELQETAGKDDLAELHGQSENTETVCKLAANSLVADHLKRCNYEYSLSVFMPESGLQEHKVIKSNKFFICYFSSMDIYEEWKEELSILENPLGNPQLRSENLSLRFMSLSFLSKVQKAFAYKKSDLMGIWNNNFDYERWWLFSQHFIYFCKPLKGLCI